MDHFGILYLTSSARDYEDHLEYFEICCMTKEELSDAEITALFLSSLGEDLRDLLKGLALPYELISLSYERLKQLILLHAAPLLIAESPSLLLQRPLFTRRQFENIRPSQNVQYNFNTDFNTTSSKDEYYRNSDTFKLENSNSYTSHNQETCMDAVGLVISKPEFNPVCSVTVILPTGASTAGITGAHAYSTSGDAAFTVSDNSCDWHAEIAGEIYPDDLELKCNTSMTDVQYYTASTFVQSSYSCWAVNFSNSCIIDSTLPNDVTNECNCATNKGIFDYYNSRLSTKLIQCHHCSIAFHIYVNHRASNNKADYTSVENLNSIISEYALELIYCCNNAISLVYVVLHQSEEYSYCQRKVLIGFIT